MKPYYDDGLVTLYNADCREVLPTMADRSIGMILTDPPYGVGVADWDKEADWAWADHAARLLVDDAHLFCFWSVSKLREFPDLPDLTYERVLVWSKPMTMSSQRAGATWHWEPVFWWKKGKPVLTECVSDVIEANPPLFRTHPENVAHPTQKPLTVIQRLLQLGGGDPVLDPFCGSGTTLVAAKAAGVRAVGIEVNKDYCDIAVKRLAQGSLFDMGEVVDAYLDAKKGA